MSGIFNGVTCGNMAEARASTISDLEEGDSTELLDNLREDSSDLRAGGTLEDEVDKELL